MTMHIQLSLFESPEESERKAMLAEIRKIHESTEKVRKKLFAENGSLKKRVMDLEERLSIIESNICNGKRDF